MIDPATGWFEMREIKNREAIEVANLVEIAWFTRYPWLYFDQRGHSCYQKGASHHEFGRTKK